MLGFTRAEVSALLLGELALLIAWRCRWTWPPAMGFALVHLILGGDLASDPGLLSAGLVILGAAASTGLVAALKTREWSRTLAPGRHDPPRGGAPGRIETSSSAGRSGRAQDRRPRDEETPG